MWNRDGEKETEIVYVRVRSEYKTTRATHGVDAWQQDYISKYMAEILLKVT